MTYYNLNALMVLSDIIYLNYIFMYLFKNQPNPPMIKSFDRNRVNLFPNGALSFEWFNILLLFRI